MDLALSSFHAIAKQTIGGLAQGLTIKPPVVFEGGPLTFNPTLIRVFTERLHLSEEEILYPDAQILSMDYEPDVSFANLENRLQMLIMSIKEQQVQKDR